MGILNVTSDSFSGDGVLNKVESAAVEQAQNFEKWGADIIDVGGESTRPGSEKVSEDVELSRVLPVIEALRTEVSIPLSVDTYKSGVARAALEAGASWINDVWGFRADPRMAEVASEFRCPVVLMHNRSSPDDVSLSDDLGGRFVGVEYDNLIEDVKRELMYSVDLALSAGVEEENIILDPGIGFGKTVEQNLQLIRRLDEIKALGFPVLLGPSRKSFIGYTLDLPVDQRVEGTAAAVSVGILKGADVVRVHDVREMVRVARMTDAILTA